MLLPFLLLLFLPATAPLHLGLDSFLSHHSTKDPQATNDTFSLLSSSLKSSLSHPSPLSSSSLLSLTVPIPITVHLVGSSFTSSAPSTLSSFLSSTLSSDQFHVITPFAASSHHLSISHSLHLSAELAAPSLATSLSSAISSHLSTASKALRSAHTSVPYTVVDEIVQEHFRKENPNSFHVYILNLGSITKESKPYAYAYTPGESSPRVSKCLGSVWAGKERYLWIDLGAGPVDYGPALSGDGVLPKGEFHPLATVHGRPKSQKALLADLASLVWSAYQVLFVPSLRIPVPFETKLIVELVHIRGWSDGNSLDWKSIERSFLDEVSDKGLLVGEQSLEFRNYEVKLAECSICSFAISWATTSYTSRYLFDNYTLIVSEYLDSKRLHQTILDAGDEFRRVAKLPEEEFARVLPVYVFDLDVNMIVLLDRYHQTVAFKDMVIAVRTKSTQTVSDYSCNGHHMFTQTRDLERPLVGSILQSMWGVSPTHMVWSPRHNNTLVDYTWSVGHTPFGPFSEIRSLSFVQKDAARRNVILTSLNFTITSAVDILDSIASHGGDRKLLKHHHAEFLQRWNLFRYKLDKTVSALSHFDYEMSLYYLRSSDHDLYAIHSLVYDASQKLEASLVCFKDPPFPWASASMSIGVFFGLLYLYGKRDKLFDNKRKRF